ncbi:reverse transcriptase [Elysia marginata]|uniref:Reverse transcriptase n=1 Tax=Elysia marginata TaxID=1093978 RepID=A0AAV4FE66_9GAST|nr:reverse transcriptase [Elysia marginata]
MIYNDADDEDSDDDYDEDDVDDDDDDDESDYNAEEIQAEDQEEKLQQLKRSISQQQLQSNNGKIWILDSKVVLKLHSLIGDSTLEHKLATFADIIYQTSLETFGVMQYQAKGPPRRSRSQFKMDTLQGGAKTRCGSSNAASTQRKGVLDGCIDWKVSADLTKWDKHPDVIRRTTLKPEIVIHSPSTQNLIMVELQVPYESRVKQAHTYKKEKYQDLIKELEESTDLNL